MAVLRAIWDAINKGLKAFGHFMSSYVVTPVLYYVLMSPFSIFARRGDPLSLAPRSGSLWHKREAADIDLEHAAQMH